MATLWNTVIYLVLFVSGGQCALQLSTYFGDHMVLQRGPQQAVLWGTADTEGDTVTAQVTGHGAHSARVTAVVSQGQWKVKLPAQEAGGPYVVHVSSSDGDVTLRDVLFGDVWLCSGQSNMGVTMGRVINSTAEIQKAAAFQNVRFTRAKFTEADTAQSSVVMNIPWSTPDSRYLSSYSAVCYLFGESLYTELQRPVGLVLSYWGGTPIEAWSSPEALSRCQHHNKRGPSGRSVLWNAMIHPLLSSTIYGALWYQGEANRNRYDQYSCQIEAMVAEWRAQFHQQSLGQTSSDFPFGYVQLAALGDTDEVGTFPGERWAQTAQYGYSPNPALPHTFMAVAMDLPDYTSPQGSIHPRYKQDVAQRLVLGALNVAYGRSDVTFQGPFPTAFLLNGGQHELSIEYDHGHTSLDVRSSDGFDVCCSAHNTTHCDDEHDRWVAAPIVTTSAGRVDISTSGCGSDHVVGMRYEWRTSPCALKQCTLYGRDSDLPAPPYITLSLSSETGTIIG